MGITTITQDDFRGGMMGNRGQYRGSATLEQAVQYAKNMDVTDEKRLKQRDSVVRLPLDIDHSPFFGIRVLSFTLGGERFSLHYTPWHYLHFTLRPTNARQQEAFSSDYPQMMGATRAALSGPSYGTYGTWPSHLVRDYVTALNEGEPLANIICRWGILSALVGEDTLEKRINGINQLNIDLANSSFDWNVFTIFNEKGEVVVNSRSFLMRSVGERINRTPETYHNSYAEFKADRWQRYRYYSPTWKTDVDSALIDVNTYRNPHNVDYDVLELGDAVFIYDREGNADPVIFTRDLRGKFLNMRYFTSGAARYQPIMMRTDYLDHPERAALGKNIFTLDVDGRGRLGLPDILANAKRTELRDNQFGDYDRSDLRRTQVGPNTVEFPQRPDFRTTNSPFTHPRTRGVDVAATYGGTDNDIPVTVGVYIDHKKMAEVQGRPVSEFIQNTSLLDGLDENLANYIRGIVASYNADDAAGKAATAATFAQVYPNLRPLKDYVDSLAMLGDVVHLERTYPWVLGLTLDDPGVVFPIYTRMEQGKLLSADSQEEKTLVDLQGVGDLTLRRFVNTDKFPRLWDFYGNRILWFDGNYYGSSHALGIFEEFDTYRLAYASEGLYGNTPEDRPLLAIFEPIPVTGGEVVQWVSKHAGHLFIGLDHEIRWLPDPFGGEFSYSVETSVPRVYGAFAGTSASPAFVRNYFLKSAAGRKNVELLVQDFTVDQRVALPVGNVLSLDFLEGDAIMQLMASTTDNAFYLVTEGGRIFRGAAIYDRRVGWSEYVVPQWEAGSRLRQSSLGVYYYGEDGAARFIDGEGIKLEDNILTECELIVTPVLYRRKDPYITQGGGYRKASIILDAPQGENIDIFNGDSKESEITFMGGEIKATGNEDLELGRSLKVSYNGPGPFSIIRVERGVEVPEGFRLRQGGQGGRS